MKTPVGIKDITNAQAELGLCYLNIPKNTYSYMYPATQHL